MMGLLCSEKGVCDDEPVDCETDDERCIHESAVSADLMYGLVEGSGIHDRCGEGGWGGVHARVCEFLEDLQTATQKSKHIISSRNIDQYDLYLRREGWEGRGRKKAELTRTKTSEH